jgi:hypothetical protein
MNKTPTNYTICFLLAEELMKMYQPLNLIFKDGEAVGTMTNTSEGFCAEHLSSADRQEGEWLYPDEFPGEDGFYDLWEVLEENGYKVWPGCISDRTVSLANWFHEQDRQS